MNKKRKVEFEYLPYSLIEKGIDAISISLHYDILHKAWTDMIPIERMEIPLGSHLRITVEVIDGTHPKILVNKDSKELVGIDVKIIPGTFEELKE